MRIVKLTAENVKRLRAVEITPDGNLQVIAGRNGQGKTSVLDAIWWALGGGAAQKGTARPVRDGETSAFVRLDLGDLVVTRTWTAEGKTSLKVEARDGAKYSSPQSMLDGLIGRLSFDPLAFSMLDEKQQLADLLALVDLPFDVAELEGSRADAYVARTDIGREAQRVKGHLESLPPVPEGTPEAEVSVADLVEQMSAAREQHAEHRVWVDEAAGISRNVALWEGKVAELERSLAQARQTLAEHEADLEGALRQVEQRGADLPDLDAIEARIGSADQINQAVRARAERARIEAEFEALRARYQDQAARIAELDETKRAGLAAAKFPVDGLGFDDTGVTYQGVPFRQCSAAERLRVSLGMAMALNPKLRVIRITDGSLLDSTNMRLIEEMAAEHDFQVWIERVDESGTVGVVIEDGSVVESDVVPHEMEMA